MNYGGQCCSNRKKIKKYFPITFFKKNGINVKKICVSSSGIGTYFISEHGKLYGCGWNRNGELGIKSKNPKLLRATLNKLLRKEPDCIYTPTLIPALSNVMDAQSCCGYSIALCKSQNQQTIKLIVLYWSRINLIAEDICYLIILFMNQYSLFYHK